MSEKDETKGQEKALVAFLQGISACIWNFFELPLEQRNRENFVRGMDGYLEKISEEWERRGEPVRENVFALRESIHKGLDQMALLKDQDSENRPPS